MKKNLIIAMGIVDILLVLLLIISVGVVKKDNNNNNVSPEKVKGVQTESTKEVKKNSAIISNKNSGTKTIETEVKIVPPEEHPSNADVDTKVNITN